MTENSNELPITDPGPQPVPVFDCHVLLQQTDSGFAARTANLDGLSATGPTERDVLMAIVKRFKDEVQSHVREGRAVPFRSEPHAPEADEVERWIPVHL